MFNFIRNPDGTANTKSPSYQYAVYTIVTAPQVIQGGNVPELGFTQYNADGTTQTITIGDIATYVMIVPVIRRPVQAKF
jgi:hypothetical protein